MEISKEELEVAKENSPKEEVEELICDFSQMFKGKGGFRKPVREARQVEQTPNWLLEIPAKLEITKEEMCERKVLNDARWKSIVKCADISDRLLSSVASAWNYLFSTKGIGKEQPLSLKTAKSILTKQNVKYQTEDDYERAQLALTVFEEICKITGQTAQSKVIIKPTLPNKIETAEAESLDYLLKGLSNTNTFYVFMTYNNILCPLGFDKTPLVPLDAFKKLEDIKPENIELWIINGSTQRFEPSFVSKRWSDVNKNLTTEWPNYLDLQEPKKGLQTYPDVNEENKSEARGNSHCIIQFKRDL